LRLGVEGKAGMSVIEILLKFAEIILVILSYYILYGMIVDLQKETKHALYNANRKIQLLEDEIREAKFDCSLRSTASDLEKTKLSRKIDKATGWEMQKLKGVKESQ
jgi:hypothetical protein